MSANNFGDDSEVTNSSQQSYELCGDNNYSENDDVNTESDTKSAHSSYSNATYSATYSGNDVVINQIDNEHFTDHNIDDNSIRKPRPLRKTCCTIITLLIGLLLFAWGLVTLAVPIYDFVLVQRLRMQPGLPPYEEWVIPTPEVRLSVYIFSVENPDTFLDGTDEKLRLIEIGPIVYREILHHENVKFHENSTLSYSANRWVEFLEDQNEPGILQRVILVPNFVLLATAASLNENWIKKLGFNSMLGDEDTVFLNMTVFDYLWFYRSSVIQRVQNIASFLVPTNNSGCLHQIYADFNDRYNVRIGPGYGAKDFFEITSVNGKTVVPGFDVAHGECNASIIGSTEGALYRNHLTEDSVLWYWRKPLCRKVPLYFEKKVQKGPFEAYRYILREDVYDRFENETLDCYKGSFQLLPDGLSDVSKCFFDMPFAASNPHFYGRYPNALTNKLEGFKPIRERHQSFIIVEPIMGVPIDQSARSQSNVIIPDLYGFNDKIQRFSNMALPTFWVEYNN
ncbi:scavenger receptor class B member 1-like isoform X2 [Sitodiplosis mosellana]|uniref:scavenger receptor class B member 1-like isoform X2 n=1 Tax=Sitodiplosis mosellana TaxID=263140 RepID=UPI002444AD06|nr:scavenger receptor class B member 1-like isoform X2 [Sitodiplosis mosellana]